MKPFCNNYCLLTKCVLIVLPLKWFQYVIPQLFKSKCELGDMQAFYLKLKKCNSKMLLLKIKIFLIKKQV